MRVIIITGENKQKRVCLLLELPDKKIVDEVKELIAALKYREALSNIVSKGKFIRELAENEISNTSSGLILTPTNAYWNLI